MSRAPVFYPRFRDMDGENGENGEKSKCLHSKDLRLAKISPSNGENGEKWLFLAQAGPAWPVETVKMVIFSRLNCLKGQVSAERYFLAEKRIQGDGE